MANFTEIIVLLDRSGSMQHIKTAMESGFTEFLNGHKVNPTTRISLVQFDSTNRYEPVYTARPITDAPPLVIEPRGMTPLLDAFCTTIDKTGERFAAMREGDRPNKVLFVVITDGAENASIQYKRADVKQRVEHQHNAYKWEFVYLGANQDAMNEAASFGISYDHAINYTASTADTFYKMRGLTSNTVAYATTGNSKSINWTDAQRVDATITNATSSAYQSVIPFPEPEPTSK